MTNYLIMETTYIDDKKHINYVEYHDMKIEIKELSIKKVIEFLDKIIKDKHRESNKEQLWNFKFNDKDYYLNSILLKNTELTPKEIEVVKQVYGITHEPSVYNDHYYIKNKNTGMINGYKMSNINNLKLI